MVTKDQMNEVLRQLAAIYPAWQQAIKTQEQADNLKRVWWDEFNRMGMEPEDLKSGVIKARSNDSAFLPSLGQFIGWCLKGRRGKLPTPEQAWQLASIAVGSNSWTNAAVYHAAARTGTYEIRNNPTKATRQLFFDHYADVVGEIDAGHSLSLPAPELSTIEHSGPTKKEMAENVAKAKVIFSDLRKQLNGESNA